MCTVRISSHYLSFPNVLVFEFNSDVSPGLPRDLTANLEITECLANKQIDAESVAAASSFLLIDQPTSSVAPALHVSSLLTGLNTIGIISTQLGISLLPVVSLSGVLSVPTSDVSIARSPDLLPRATFLLSSVLLTPSAVATMSPTSIKAASHSFALLQYLCHRLAQREAEFSKSDDKHGQRGESVTFLEARLADT